MLPQVTVKEITDIIKAYHQAAGQGKQSALATVVHVEGSSYRRPGARMLVTDDGQLTGAISGGCLEGDALRKAMLAISQGQNKLVTYDTTDEDDLKFGVQLGCNGIVHILFEPIHPNAALHPIKLLEEVVTKREPAVLVTLFSLKAAQQYGTCLLYRNGTVQTGLGEAAQQSVIADAVQVWNNQTSALKEYRIQEVTTSAFVEYLAPPIAVAIAGAGNDVKPLVQMTSILGWHTTVVDGRHTHATVQRFPQADNVVVAKPAEVLKHLTPDAQTVFLLMTHNYNYDLALLKELLHVDCGYIGVLGPKKKMQRMFEELAASSVTVTEEQYLKIHSPIGLDIGAETAEEIAVSVVAEIMAVLSGRNGAALKNKPTSIHSTASTPIRV